jgi:hypothetical protein
VEDTPYSLLDPAICDTPLHPMAEEGLRLMNAGKYFAAHEALEAAWNDDQGQGRELYRGILQVAVAYYHLTRGNTIGAMKMLKRCWAWLAPFPEHCHGIDVGQLKRDAQALEIELNRLGPDRPALLDPRLCKPVLWIRPSDPTS